MGPEALESAHERLETLYELGNQGGPKLIVRGTRAASCDLALGSVSPNEPVILLIDLLSHLENMIQVHDDSGPEFSDGGGIQCDFHLLVGFLQSGVKLFQVQQILLHNVDFRGEHLERAGVVSEPPPARVGGPRSGGLVVFRLHENLEGTVECFRIHFLFFLYSSGNVLPATGRFPEEEK